MHQRNEELSSRDVKRPVREPMTNRKVWIGTIVVTALLLVARSATIYGTIGVKLDENGIGEQIQDKGLEQLAVNVGFMLAIIISLAVLLALYSIAALMERNIFRVNLKVMPGVRIGPFYPVVFASTIPVQIVCLLFGLSSPKDSLIYYLYVVAVGLACPLLFRRVWKNLPKSKVTTYFVCSFGLAVLSMAT